MEAKNISQKLTTGLDNRIDRMPRKNTAFISLKDHKTKFLPCRLTNPSKSNIGKISKSILDKVNQNLRNKLQFNQWKNSENVIDWFKMIENNSLILRSFTHLSLNQSFQLQFALQKTMLNSQMKKKE